MTMLSVLTILTIVVFTNQQQTRKYSMNITNSANSEHACSFVGTRRYQLTIEPEIDNANDLFFKNLTLKLIMPQGTQMASRDIRIEWDGIQASVDEINMNGPFVSTTVQLQRGIRSYTLTMWNYRAFVNPFSSGMYNSAISISTRDNLTLIYGETAITLMPLVGS